MILIIWAIVIVFILVGYSDKTIPLHALIHSHPVPVAIVVSVVMAGLLLRSENRTLVRRGQKPLWGSGRRRIR